MSKKVEEKSFMCFLKKNTPGKATQHTHAQYGFNMKQLMIKKIFT